MKLPGCLQSHRLVSLLEDALLREERLWKVPVYKNGLIQGTDTSSSQHQEVIGWLREMSRLFHFCPETFALGVCVLHRMLSTVKAQPKYLKCIAFTSLILAAKTNEEDEVIGSVKDLVLLSGCSFSTAEILRMERIILDKLGWDLYTATPVDFIHIFHALLVSGHPFLIPSIGLGSGPPSLAPSLSSSLSQSRPPGLQVALWSRQVQHCMACHQLWQFKGSTLALAIITLELEEVTADWFTVCTGLMKRAGVDSAEFIHCRETVDEFLHSLEFSLSRNAVFILEGAHIRSSERRGRERGGRDDEEGGGNGDEFYDGFICLYSEEMTAITEANGKKSDSPCPPLHPPL